MSRVWLVTSASQSKVISIGLSVGLSIMRNNLMLISGGNLGEWKRFGYSKNVECYVNREKRGFRKCILLPLYRKIDYCSKGMKKTEYFLF